MLRRLAFILSLLAVILSVAKDLRFLDSAAYGELQRCFAPLRVCDFF